MLDKKLIGGMYITRDQRSSQVPAVWDAQPAQDGTVWTSKEVPVFLQINQIKLSSSASYISVYKWF